MAAQACLRLVCNGVYRAVGSEHLYADGCISLSIKMFSHLAWLSHSTAQHSPAYLPEGSHKTGRRLLMKKHIHRLGWLFGGALKVGEWQWNVEVKRHYSFFLSKKKRKKEGRERIIHSMGSATQPLGHIRNWTVHLWALGISFRKSQSPYLNNAL